MVNRLNNPMPNRSAMVRGVSGVNDRSVWSGGSESAPKRRTTLKISAITKNLFEKILIRHIGVSKLFKEKA